MWSPGCLSAPHCLFFKQVKSLRAAEAVVCMTTLDKLLGSLSVEVQPLRLQVRSKRATTTRTLVWRCTWRRWWDRGECYHYKQSQHCRKILFSYFDLRSI